MLSNSKPKSIVQSAKSIREIQNVGSSIFEIIVEKKHQRIEKSQHRSEVEKYEFDQLESTMSTLTEGRRDQLKSRLESQIQINQGAKSDVEEATKALLEAAMREDIDPETGR